MKEESWIQELSSPSKKDEDEQSQNVSNTQKICIRKSRMHIPFLIEKVKERRPDGSLVLLEEIETLH